MSGWGCDASSITGPASLLSLGLAASARSLLLLGPRPTIRNSVIVVLASSSASRTDRASLGAGCQGDAGAVAAGGAGDASSLQPTAADNKQPSSKRGARRMFVRDARSASASDLNGIIPALYLDEDNATPCV
jgi:hypothetical protein